MARPTDEKYKITDMIEKIEIYTDNTFVPILKEICYKNHWNYVYVMELQKKHIKLSESIKRLLDKKEADLERGGLNGTLEKTTVVFSLKQLGWKDNAINIEQSINGGIMPKVLEVLKDVRKNMER